MTWPLSTLFRVPIGGMAVVLCAGGALSAGCNAFLAERGGGGQPCFDNKKCLHGLACTDAGVCEEPKTGRVKDGGGNADDSRHDRGTSDIGGVEDDAGHDASDEPDSNGDVGLFDGGGETGVLDTGQDTGMDAGADVGCVAFCAGRECGDDGCEGSCGDCTPGPPDDCWDTNTLRDYEPRGYCKAWKCQYSYAVQDCEYRCENAKCISCTPNCFGKCAGSDGCGGTCPDNCVPPQMCGGGGTPNVCATVTPSCGPSPTGKGGDMCDVPAGPFMMGCDSAVDSECDGAENPYHGVNVPAFKIDKYEVTASEYKACVTGSGCTAENTGSGCNFDVPVKESHPINCVYWDQAKAYCTWAGKTLPTEAQWEKAARGTDGRKYPWGNTGLDCDHAVHSVSPCSNSGTAAVGSKPSGASPYGAEDMIGNVREWVEDWYHNSYSGAPTDGSAWVNPSGTYRVARGGGWDYNITDYLRASNRAYSYPTNWDNSYGFRCARDGS